MMAPTHSQKSLPFPHSIDSLVAVDLPETDETQGDPLYVHTEAPAIFLSPASCEFSKDLIGAVSNRGPKVAYNRDYQQRVDHRRISDVIGEIERLLNGTMHPIRSVPASESGSCAPSVRASVEHTTPQSTSRSLTEALEYKVSLLEREHEETAKIAATEQKHVSKISRGVRRQMRELRMRAAAEDADLADMMHLNIGYLSLM